MRKTIGMVFAGGRGEELSVLTERRPKSAVVFGGIYRAIDFALTNLANAGIGRVGILAQYRPGPLMDHVGTGLAWDLVGTTRAVRFLPPYLKPAVSEWYRGPADALYQNVDFIESAEGEDVLVVSGDHVYAMDYRALLDFHQEHDADLTMAFTPRDADPQRFGIGELNAASQIMNFSEKPELPKTNLASMSVYAFRRAVLVDELRRAETGDDVTFQVHEVIRRMISRRRAYGFVHHGPWFYSQTLDEYYAFHRDLLGSAPRIDLGHWQVHSNVVAGRVAPPPPARALPGASIVDSFVSPGCVIEGTVESSILSPGVRVGPGAVVRDSVLWDDVVVEAGARLSAVVADQRVVFGRDAEVGVGDLAPCEEQPHSLRSGATVIGMSARLPGRARIGRNCLVHPEVQPEDVSAPIRSGQSVRPSQSRQASS